MRDAEFPGDPPAARPVSPRSPRAPSAGWQHPSPPGPAVPRQPASASMRSDAFTFSPITVSPQGREATSPSPDTRAQPSRAPGVRVLTPARLPGFGTAPAAQRTPPGGTAPSRLSACPQAAPVLPHCLPPPGAVPPAPRPPTSGDGGPRPGQSPPLTHRSPLTPTAPARCRRLPARFPFSSSCQEKRKKLIWWRGQDGQHQGSGRGQDGAVGSDSLSQDNSVAPHEAPRGPARPSVPLPSAAPGCVARVKLTPDTGSRRAVSAAGSRTWPWGTKLLGKGPVLGQGV